MKKKLCVCIPTYNRPDNISWKLYNELDVYNKYNIDVYIWDSSPDNRTEEVVLKYKEKINNLHYVKIPSSVHSNKKIYMIFQNADLISKYEYIWTCTDALSWQEVVYSSILDAANKDKYDFIIPDNRDVENIGTKEYSDANILFHDFCWHMTLYGATVVRCDTILRNVDWESFEKKYFVKNMINFSHLAFYFEKIAELDNFNALHISYKDVVVISRAFVIRSGWHKDVFDVWLRFWPDTIKALPDIYKDKDEVIQRGNKNAKVFSNSNLLGYRCANVLNSRSFSEYSDAIRKYSGADYNYAKTLVSKPAVFCKKPENIIRLLLHHINMVLLLKNFCKEYKNLYICGYGEYYEQIEKMLKLFRVKPDGVIRFPLELKGRNTFNIDEYEMEDFEKLDDNTGIILAVELTCLKYMQEMHMLDRWPKKNVFSEYFFKRKGFRTYREE